MKYLSKKLLLILLLLLLGITTNGLIVEKATLEEITSESALIIHGKVVSKKSVWENNSINTYLTIQVFDVAKGSKISNTVTVKQRGGKLGIYADEVPGQPNYEIDDEVFFFLVDWKGNYWIHSIALGGYSVIETGGVKYAVNEFNDIELVQPAKQKVGEELKGEYLLSDIYSKVKLLASKE